MVEKLERDGKVAVIISPGYGAGWSTWASRVDPEEVLFDKRLAELIENKLYREVEEYVEKKWPDVYSGGVSQLKVEWLDRGEAFTVREYDGFERILFVNKQAYYVA